MWQGLGPISGFHEPERDAVGDFCWTKGRFHLAVRRDAGFAELKLCYHGSDGTLLVTGPSGFSIQMPLAYGWQICTLPLAGLSAADMLDFQILPVITEPADERELGVMLRRAHVFDDPRRCELQDFVKQNLALNEREYRSGAPRLESYPPLLRVTIESRCNIPETGQPCVYCAWDWAKLAEQGSPSFTRNSFDEFGQFYRAAAEIGDCSIGEPTMNKDFGAIVAQVDGDGKQFSFTTNGQLLSANRRRELLGRDCVLYVSLDSATAAGYARYRNDRFDDILANLSALCREKRSHNNLPHVFVSLILMRSNVAELAPFFALMNELGVDEVKIRSLYLDNNLPNVVWNNGHGFDYTRELLTVDESQAMARRARSLAGEWDLPVYIEAEQALTTSDKNASSPAEPAGENSQGVPLCAEPWKAIYALKRGIMPCCYATEPIATWRQQQGRTREQFLRDVFNGPKMQEIRAGLAAGELPQYCRNTPSCPVLKRQKESGSIDVTCNAFQERVFGSPPEAGDLPLVSLVQLSIPVASTV